jgi:hypothetical protein
MSPDQAIENCRAAVRQEARQRFGTDDVNFRQINVDDQRGNRDLVVGTIGLRDRGRGEDSYPFSCTMNLNNGRVRQASITDTGNNRDNRDYAGRDSEARGMDTCRSAVENRIGDNRVEFGPMDVQDRNGEDLVRGSARSRGRNYQFTCSVNPYSGNVRGVDVRQR